MANIYTDAKVIEPLESIDNPFVENQIRISQNILTLF